MRSTVITAAEACAALLVLPLLAARRVGVLSHLAGSQILSLVPGMLGLFLRRAWYRKTLAECGSGLSVSFGTVLNNEQARVGSNCYFGTYCIVGLCDVGDDLICADHVQLLSGMRHHGVDRRDIPMARQGAPQKQRIQIGADVWIGAGAIVGADVPAHCVVAAGAVVTKAVDAEWLIVGGVPAKRVGVRP